MLDWLQEHDWQAWLSLAILLAGLEMLSLDLVLLMLAAGAVVGMALALVGLPIWVQVLAMAGTSVAMLAVARPKLARRLHGGPELTHGHNRLIGTQGVVTQELSGLSVGRVKLGGDVWSAQPYDESLTLAPGTTVEVLEIRGATALVHPVPELPA